MSSDNSHLNPVLAGHKANLSNPTTSEASKEHSAAILSDAAGEKETKDPKHVAAGLKAAINNPNVGPEATATAEEKLEELQAHSGENEKNPKQVAAGLKGAITNQNNSEEAKEAAKEKLNEMGY